MLRGLNPAERAVLFAYAEGEGTTWTEAASAVGAAAPEAFGERVRRKAKRLAAEQARRTAQRHTNTPHHHAVTRITPASRRFIAGGPAARHREVKHPRSRKEQQTVNRESAHDRHHLIPGRRAGDGTAYVVSTEDGIRLESPDKDRSIRIRKWSLPLLSDVPPDLARAIAVRGTACGTWPNQEAILGLTRRPTNRDAAVDRLAAEILVLPRSQRWREAVSTALAGSWCDPLWQTGQLPATALGVLKAEARTVHRQLVPLWEQGTRRGRVLSLDADLGGVSLYDLVAADVDLLAYTTDGVYEDERLNRVLRGLTENEKRVVVAYAAREGTTWTEAASAVGAPEPQAFGTRVRRKVKRLVDEQARRTAQPYGHVAQLGPAPAGARVLVPGRGERADQRPSEG